MNKNKLAEAIDQMVNGLYKQGKFSIDMNVDGYRDKGTRPNGTRRGYCGCFAGLWGWVREDLLERHHYFILADDLANFLGYESGEDLAAWAAENPQIWGNSHGGLMFHSADAWGSIGKNADAWEVIYHLQAVLARLEAAG